ncbi:MAG TPA: DUF1028 domain-containing protein [Candidatus Dormibacteraeota bacterium]
MTFSIVAFEPESKSWGVAVASKCLAVGHAVPWGAAHAGAVATQALANLSYGPDGVALLRSGQPARRVVEALTRPDKLASQRQLGVVDAKGTAANHTGADCLPWAGGIVDGDVAVQGNILAGEQVPREMLGAYRASRGQPFVRRLLSALEAGDAAGGDRRGRQSSAVRVWREGAAYGGGLDVAVDLRVDDHASPIAELRRLVDLHHLYFVRPDPATLIDIDQGLTEEIGAALATLGYEPEKGFRDALARWIGTENFEERDVPGKIDPLVLAHLRKQVSAVPA